MQQNAGNFRPARLPAKPPMLKPERKHAIPQKMVGSIVNLAGVMVYLWLQNGQGFWFYIANTQRDRITGFAWMGQGWQRREVFLKVIWSYY